MKSIMKIFSGEKWTFLPRISFSFSANRDDVEKNSLRLSSTKEKWIEFHARLDFYFFPLVFFRDFSEIKYHCVGGIFQYWRMEIYVKPLSCSISLKRILMSNFGFQTEWKKLVKQVYNDFQICKSVGQGQAKHWDKQFIAQSIRKHLMRDASRYSRAFNLNVTTNLLISTFIQIMSVNISRTD